MTLDDDRLAALRADQERDDADARAEWEERCLVESIEAEEAHWEGVMRAQPESMRNVHYDEPSVLDRAARFPHD